MTVGKNKDLRNSEKIIILIFNKRGIYNENERLFVGIEDNFGSTFWM